LSTALNTAVDHRLSISAARYLPVTEPKMKESIFPSFLAFFYAVSQMGVRFIVYEGNYFAGRGFCLYCFCQLQPADKSPRLQRSDFQKKCVGAEDPAARRGALRSSGDNDLAIGKFLNQNSSDGVGIKTALHVQHYLFQLSHRSFNLYYNWMIKVNQKNHYQK